MANNGIYLHVDITDAQKMINDIRGLYTEEAFNRLLAAAFKRTAEHTRTELSNLIPLDYKVAKKDVKNSVGRADVNVGGVGKAVSCCIPIEGHRGAIGGSGMFSATGGRHGWKNIKPGKRYKVKAKVLKASQSVLPTEIDNVAGEPPFRNLSAKKLNGITFTRAGKEKDAPLRKIVGIAVPQMPINRSKDRVEKSIRDKLFERIEHEHDVRIRRIANRTKL